MRRSEHLGARVLTLVGLVSAVGYLAWRALFTLSGTRLWLSVPVLLVELVAFLGAAALAWALWPAPHTHVTATAPPAGAVDVVVRVQHQLEHEVRATLLTIRGIGAAQLIVVDLASRPPMAALAAEFHAHYVTADATDGSGLTAALAAVTAPHFLLLDAGDIPANDIVTRLAAELADERIAVVQGLGLAATYDSPEHGPGGRHELLFERVALNPALGARGAAIWTGSGSLVRTEAVRAVSLVRGSALVTSWLAGAAMAARGWRLVAPGDVPVFAHRTILAEQDVFDDRVERVRGARRMVFGRRGALRGRGLPRQLRLALLAWSVRPLSSLRRVAFVAVLEAALLAGTVPFHASTVVLICAWAPSFLYLSLGLALLSGWTLRPGDRARWSLHSIGPAWASIHQRRAPQPSRHSHSAREPIVALPARQYGGGLVTVVVSLGIVLLLRGASDRLTHTLGELPRTVLMLLLLITLWVLALSLDLLRVLGRHHQLRRTARVVSSLPATMGERSVSIVDLTSLGAGVLSQTGAELKERTVLETVIPTTSGVTSVRQPCVVRNVTLLPSGDYRIGVEFGNREAATANALAEYCSVEPMWLLLGVLPGQSVTDQRRTVFLDEPEATASPGRALVRTVALIALLGATASAVPETAAASATQEHRMSGSIVETGEPPLPADPGSVVDTVPDSLVDTDEPSATTEPVTVEAAAPAGVLGAVVVGVCSIDIGDDGSWGTADDDYQTPVATVTDADGNYELEMFGVACWVAVDPPDGYAVVEVTAGDEIAPAVVDVSGGTTTRPVVRLQPIVEVDHGVPPSAGELPGGDGSDGARADAAAYRLGSRLDQATAEWSAEPVAGRAPRVLPVPEASQLGDLPQTKTSMSIFVLALSALLAGGLLAGLARPRSRVVR
ncbi:MAG: hypothetical protein ABMA25_12755 [Ilumatobacteraceae bacterium]